MTRDDTMTRYAWICHGCGVKYGRRTPGFGATYHMGECDICGSLEPVTEPRDYGGLSAPVTDADSETSNSAGKGGSRGTGEISKRESQ